VVDFGRVMVAPLYRGHDHFELILLEGLLWSSDNEFEWVVGSLRPARGFRPFIHGLGFTDSGPAVKLRLGGQHLEMHQPLKVRTTENRARWAGRKVAVLDRLRQKGNDIRDHGCPVS
jgi:hypothetical protein